jgi:hypothetical protein
MSLSRKGVAVALFRPVAHSFGTGSLLATVQKPATPDTPRNQNTGVFVVFIGSLYSDTDSGLRMSRYPAYN